MKPTDSCRSFAPGIPCVFQCFSFFTYRINPRTSLGCCGDKCPAPISRGSDVYSPRANALGHSQGRS